MDCFDTFVENNMLEQIKIIDRVVMANDQAAVTPLLELYGSKGCDQAVEEVMYHALQQLMQGSDGAIFQGLNHPSVDIQLLAMRCGCETGSPHFQSYLVDKLQETTDPLLLAEIIKSLATFADPELITVLLPYMNHDDSGVAGSCIDLLASVGGVRARDGLVELVQREMDQFNAVGGCSFVAALAMECLAGFSDEKIITFLVAHIHHDSPSFRRLVGETLINMGIEAVPALVYCVERGGNDEKIMAINCLGFIRHRKGSEALIACLDTEYAWDINIRFAMFEAIGRIDCLRSALCLADALTLEEDEFVLNAVLTGLDRICHPGLAKVFSDLLCNEKKAVAMVRKLLALRLKNILKVVYEIPDYRRILYGEVANLGSRGVSRFCTTLFRSHAVPFPPDLVVATPLSVDLPFHGKRILVVDDSKAIIRFYAEVAEATGFDIISAYDGKEALDYLQQEGSRTIDLLLTDMNMPHMDGIELVCEVRQMECFYSLPILMATTESGSSQCAFAHGAGVNGFISKPFSREVLVGRLQEMLHVV